VKRKNGLGYKYLYENFICLPLNVILPLSI
jgi:hypothetical protein